MATLAKHLVICHTPTSSSSATHKERRRQADAAQTPLSGNPLSRRRSLLSTLMAASAWVSLPPAAPAQDLRWGTKSFLKERFFEPGLSPEESAARIRHTAEGLRAMREMLDTMSWRYCIFYIRLKSAYLSSDLKNALSTLPESRRSTYVQAANQLVENMVELDYYVRTPKIYESYVYYEKTLKSLDDIVALL